MSDFSQGPGWWLASDGKWYPPQGEAAPPSAPATPAYGQPSYAPQPDYSQPNYGTQPNYAAYGQQQGSGLPSVNGMAVASMVLGIVSLVFCWCYFIGGPCALVGLPLGAVALSKISKGQADPRPKGMAIAGVVCSIISLAVVIVFIVWIASVGNGTYWWSRN